MGPESIRLLLDEEEAGAWFNPRLGFHGCRHQTELAGGEFHGSRVAGNEEPTALHGDDFEMAGGKRYGLPIFGRKKINPEKRVVDYCASLQRPGRACVAG